MKTRTQTTAAFCEPCALVFRTPAIYNSGSNVSLSVACPQCGRKASVELLSDGRLQLKHNKHVYVCPKALDHNPLVVALTYLGGTVAIALAFGAVAKMVGAWVCPVIFAATFVSVAIIGGIQLASANLLKKSFLDLVGIFVRAMPNLYWGRAPAGTISEERPEHRAEGSQD